MTTLQTIWLVLLCSGPTAAMLFWTVEIWRDGTWWHRAMLVWLFSSAALGAAASWT